MAQSTFERLREAAALQRSLRETHGDEAEEVLAEHIAVGAPRTDRFPLPLVTDRRVLHAIDRNLRGWTILSQAPAAEITGAEVKKGLISGRLQAYVRHGEGPSLRVNRLQRAEEVAALLRHLAAGGAPPR